MAAKEKKTFQFAWEGKDKNGNLNEGKIDAVSISAAKSALRRQGINPKKVKKVTSFSLFSKADKKIEPLDIAFFTRQMATMMRAGVPLMQSVEIVATGAEKNKMRDMLNKIKGEVNAGTDFSKALSAFPDQFDDLYCNLVAAGERSGALEAMLDRLATYKEKIEKLKAKIKKALTYPAAVVVVGVIVTAILLVKVVPQFEAVFKDFGADLPAFTKMVVGLSEFAQAWWWVALFASLGAILAFNKARKTSQSFQDSVDRFILKLPVVGPILHQAAIARFASTLATTFAAGVPLVNALESAAGAAGNVVYRNAILQIRSGVSTGQSLQNAVNMTGVFPPMTVQMIAIGEESGALDMMLSKIAEYYEDEVDNAVDNLSSLIEPMIMSVLGVLVGGLVIAMYLPIFQLGNAI
ncbi:MAG: type II secretion system F family protein [Pontibacterium sp.]